MFAVAKDLQSRLNRLLAQDAPYLGYKPVAGRSGPMVSVPVCSDGQVQWGKSWGLVIGRRWVLCRTAQGRVRLVRNLRAAQFLYEV